MEKRMRAQIDDLIKKEVEKVKRLKQRLSGIPSGREGSLAEDLAALHREKRDVLVVSSGAIALGRAVLKLPAGPLKLEDSQAAAALA